MDTTMKSERLKKLEAELGDLEQWMKLGLVPNRELERHRGEIHSLKERIVEEQKRLLFLKESGDVEEFVAPRRGPAKTVYADTPSMSDVGVGETTEGNFTADQDTASETSDEGTQADETVAESEDEDDPFSDKNRWKRGGIRDPEADDW